MQGGPVVFYDGVCGLCHRSVRFILRRDRAARFRFAALQSPLAKEALAAHGRDPADLDTVYVLDGDRLLWRSRAVLFVLERLPRWRLFARIVGVLPTVVLDFFYRIVARIRYRLFGRFDACAIPSPAERARFLDAA